MITLGPALFDNNNRLITLRGGYKNLRYLTQFIVTTFYMLPVVFLIPLMEMRCVRPLPFLMTGQS